MDKVLILHLYFVAVLAFGTFNLVLNYQIRRQGLVKFTTWCLMWASIGFMIYLLFRLYFEIGDI